MLQPPRNGELENPEPCGLWACPWGFCNEQFLQTQKVRGICSLEPLLMSRSFKVKYIFQVFMQGRKLKSIEGLFSCICQQNSLSAPFSPQGSHSPTKLAWEIKWKPVVPVEERETHTFMTHLFKRDPPHTPLPRIDKRSKNDWDKCKENIWRSYYVTGTLHALPPISLVRKMRCHHFHFIVEDMKFKEFECKRKEIWVPDPKELLCQHCAACTKLLSYFRTLLFLVFLWP